jgi:hypothetical protein
MLVPFFQQVPAPFRCFTAGYSTCMGTKQPKMHVIVAANPIIQQ